MAHLANRYDQFFILKVACAQIVSQLLQKHMIIPSLYYIFCNWNQLGLIAYTHILPTMVAISTPIFCRDSLWLTMADNN